MYLGHIGEVHYVSTVRTLSQDNNYFSQSNILITY